MKPDQFNAAAAGLTEAENRTYKCLMRLYSADQIIKAGNLVDELGVSRFTVYRDLVSLIRKGLVEKYESFFYRPKQNKRKQNARVSSKKPRR